MELLLLAGLPLGELYGRGFYGAIEGHLRAVMKLMEEDRLLWGRGVEGQWH